MTSLAEKAKSAVYWNTGFNLFRDLLQFGVMLILVRIIPPEAYGQLGLMNSVVGLLAVFNLNNLMTHYLIQREESEKYYHYHFYFGIFLQGGLFLISIFVAFISKSFETYQPIFLLLCISSFLFLLEFPANFQIKYYEKELKWKRFRALHIVGLISSSILSITFAFLGFGVYALIIPPLLIPIPFIYDLVINRKWRPKFIFNFNDYKKVLKFGLYQIPTNLVDKFKLLFESSLLVNVIGFAEFGILGRAYGLSQMLCYKISSQLMYTYLPIISKLTENKTSFDNANILMLRFITFTILPISAIISISAYPIVNLIYGPDWIEVSKYIPLTFSINILMAINLFFSTIFTSTFNYKYNLYLNILLLGLTTLGLIFILPFSVSAYLSAIIGAQSVILLTNLIIAIRNNVLKLKNFLFSLVPSVPATIGSLLFCKLFIDNFTTRMTYNLNIIFLIIIFIFIYMLMSRFLFNRYLLSIINYLPYNSFIKKLLFY